MKIFLVTMCHTLRFICRHSVDGYYTPPARPLKLRIIFQNVKSFAFYFSFIFVQFFLRFVRPI